MKICYENSGIEFFSGLPEKNLKSHIKGWTRRDLTIVPVTEQNCLVIACDSCGGIGVKDSDVLKIPPRYAAKFTARVALTEVLCSGALPVTITNGAACEMKPTGEEIILGINDELKNAGITDIVLTGSTEENFTTHMTALAITVIGIAKESKLRFGCAESGDKLILFGIPCVGDEVDLESAGFYMEIKALLHMAEVKEIVPVGSKGVAYEAETIAELNNVVLKLYETEIDCFKSAGPATCLLILCGESAVDKVLSLCSAATVIGEIQWIC